jgi:hypothetical protein
MPAPQFNRRAVKQMLRPHDGLTVVLAGELAIADEVGISAHSEHSIFAHGAFQCVFQIMLDGRVFALCKMIPGKLTFAILKRAAVGFAPAPD